MPEAVCRMLTLLCALVRTLPIGTNLGLLHLLWMLTSGRLLASRGAPFPGPADGGVSARAVRRAWAALGQGDWTSAQLLGHWAAVITREGRWQPHTHSGYRPVAVDVTGCWRPRLHACPTTHDHQVAGRALPAIPVGLIARVGHVGAQRLALPLAFVRADPADPSPSAHARPLVQEAVRQRATDDILVLDAGFGVALLQAAGAPRYVVRLAKNATFRQAPPPAYGGRGRPPTRGAVVRPLSRTYRGRVRPATRPDRVETWREEAPLLRAEIGDTVVRADADADSPPFAVLAIHDPRFRAPLLLATPLPLPARSLRDGYVDRWPIEQLPLAAKRLLGAARPCVHGPETCRRLPALTLLAGAVLSSAAATAPAIPTGFWDRHPQPTPGPLRRLRAGTPFPHDFPLPARIREKATATSHRRTGFWGQRRPADAPTAPPALPEAA